MYSRLLEEPPLLTLFQNVNHLESKMRRNIGVGFVRLDGIR